MFFLDIARTIFFYTASSVYCFFLIIPLFIFLYLGLFFKSSEYIFYILIKTLAKGILFFTCLPVVYQGFKDLPNDRPVIFIANHQSALDILLITGAIGSYHSIWIAKSELYDYPLLNILYKKLCIAVPLKNNQKLYQDSVVLQAIKKVKEGNNIIIFPEGSRFTDGFIHEFYSGFAAIAKETNALVVPLFISGTGKALAPGTRVLKKSSLGITVGPSFVFHKDESVFEFKKRIFNWFVELSWRNIYLQEHYGIKICNTVIDTNNTFCLA